MPTVLRSGPYRLLIYSGDRNEPPHVHAERDTSQAKFWLQPVRLAWSRGFSGSELRKIEVVVTEHAQELLEAWNEFFSG